MRRIERLVTRLKRSKAPATAARLCENCKKIPRSFFIPLSVEVIMKMNREGYSYEGDDVSPGVHMLHPSQQALTDGASQGCQLCGLILKSNGLLVKSNISYSPRGNGPVIIKMGDWYGDPEIIEVRELVGSSYHEFAKLLFTTVPSSWSRSEETVVPRSVIKTWLDVCNKTHENCRKPSDSQRFIPARVVDLHPGQNGVTSCIRSEKDLSGEIIDYVALSYCWGTTMPDHVKTTTKNLSTRCNQGILEEELPATLRDAFEVTRQLGLRYLWIDALCILQDSENDWHTNAADMGRVYSSAYCSLAADTASDTTSGLPRHDFKNQVSHDDLILHFSDDSGQLSDDAVCVSLSGLYRVEDGYRSIKSEPLHRRGWTLQERHLSHRTVHFSRTGLLWECKQGQSSTRLPWMPWSSVPNPESWRLADFDDVSVRKHLQYGTWGDICFDLSWRQFTYEKDRLMAISGMVKHIESLLSSTDQYLAGLWRDTLPFSMCWYAGNRVLEFVDDWDDSATARAPSWSWASIYGHLIYCFPPSTMRQTLASVVHANATETHYDTELGLVYSGQVVLKGTLKALNLRFVSTSSREMQKFFVDGLGYHATLHADESGDEEERSVGLAIVDRPPPTSGPTLPTWQEVLCLPICLVLDKGKLEALPENFWPRQESPDSVRAGFIIENTVLGLLLEPGGKDGEYRRIGATMYMPQRLFNGLEEREITLV